MDAIRAYEATLSAELLKKLTALGATVYGFYDPQKTQQRVPTVCFSLRDVAPANVSDGCAQHGIGIRDENMYSPRLLKRLGIPSDTGAVRASLAHYNTVEEIHRFVDVLSKIARP